MTLKLTQYAAHRILTLIKEEATSNPLMLRVMVSGGGCSGFQYGFSLDTTRQAEDHVFESDGVTVVIDEASLALLEGGQIDYVEDLMGASFQIKNPNASTSCGCGNSFSI